ncbi:unnamed protein product [Eruca vesicaria subsp. sativa]|uniref:Uncharacterized protein n=1 Tax=Eruca vesicaria subsp. sativa TaxID=29727 RepID=A0ABC8LXK1_ERUVS|nr:unnamed protein product [Eruca vesicaria subsp. sativa]
MSPIGPHFPFVTYPSQGHINQSLELAKRLARTITRARVTFTAPISAYDRSMFSKENSPETLIFATYSDGHDDCFKSSTSSEKSRKDTAGQYISEMRQRGRETLTELIKDSRRQNRPFICVVYTMVLLTWLSWRPVTIFFIFNYYFNSYTDAISEIVTKTTVLVLLNYPLCHCSVSMIFLHSSFRKMHIRFFCRHFKSRSRN